MFKMDCLTAFGPSLVIFLWILVAMISGLGPLANLEFSGSFHAYNGTYIPGLAMVSGDAMEDTDCGAMCVMDWECTGYCVDWVTPDTGYCSLVRQSNPLSMSEVQLGSTFYRKITNISIMIRGLCVKTQRSLTEQTFSEAYTWGRERFVFQFILC